LGKPETPFQEDIDGGVTYKKSVLPGAKRRGIPAKTEDREAQSGESKGTVSQSVFKKTDLNRGPTMIVPSAARKPGTA
jgi:hypothetical protein